MSLSPFDTLQDFTRLASGSCVTADGKTGVLTLTLVIPDTLDHSAFVLECTHSGQEYLADVLVSPTVSPLQIQGEMSSGSFNGVVMKQQEANLNHSL